MSEIFPEPIRNLPQADRKQQDIKFSRRDFLASAVGAAALAVLPKHVLGEPNSPQVRSELDFPLIDYHVHIWRNRTIEDTVKLSKERGIKYGIVENFGVGRKMGGDSALKSYIDSLKHYPVYKGMQAEGRDWMNHFSKEVIAQLDYVLTDAFIFPYKDGQALRLWNPNLKIEDKQDFMDRYVDFNISILSNEPIDILASPTVLPVCLRKEYDVLWTKERMKKVIDAAVKNDVAMEINSLDNVPSAAFVKMAKKMGAKFTFGSNCHHGRDPGWLEYSVKIAKLCGLTKNDMFTPKPDGMKPIQKIK